METHLFSTDICFACSEVTAGLQHRSEIQTLAMNTILLHIYTHMV